jgi:hypothetical protein
MHAYKALSYDDGHMILAKKKKKRFNSFKN